MSVFALAGVAAEAAGGGMPRREESGFAQLQGDRWDPGSLRPKASAPANGGVSLRGLSIGESGGLGVRTTRLVTRWLGPFYGFGYLGVAVVAQVVMMWVTYFYSPPPEAGLTIYVPISLVGWAMVIGRMVDAIADPLVAVWSDNTTSRWGRRIPFILFGAPPLILSFIFLWKPPVAEISWFNFLYLALVLSAFFFFFTVVVAPYLALLPEIARGVRQRVNLAAWQAFFNIIGLAIAMVGSALLVERFGFFTMGLVIGLVALISYWIPALTVAERRPEGRTTGIGFWQSIVLTLRNRPFIFYILSQICFWFGFNMVMITAAYFVTVVMGLGEGQVGLTLGLTMLVAMISFPLITLLARKKGTKSAMLFTTALFVVILAALASFGRWPLPISPALQGFILFGAAGVPLAGLFVLPNAIVAELTDYDQAITGQRREAIYYGMQGLAVKAAMGLSSLGVSLLLNTFGYSQSRPLGILLSGPVAAFFTLVGFVIFLAYPLGKADVGEDQVRK